MKLRHEAEQLFIEYKICEQERLRLFSIEPFKTFENQTIIDDDVILAGSNAARGAYFGTLPIEVWDGQDKSLDEVDAKAVQILPLDDLNYPVNVLTTSFLDLDKDDILKEVIAKAMVARCYFLGLPLDKYVSLT